MPWSALALVLLSAGLPVLTTADAGMDSNRSPALVPIQPIKGITLAPIEDRSLGPVGYGSEQCVNALNEIADLGATWISLTPVGRMADLNSYEVLHDFEIPATTNEELIRRTAGQARALGLKVALIPHVYVTSGKWRGQIDPGSDEAWDEWFESYKRFLGRYATLAQEIDAALFSVGVEFKSSTNYYPERWRELIDFVRSIYSGKLTYSANWDEAEYIEFWDALDLIGINAFWPLTWLPGQGFEMMCEMATTRADETESLSIHWDRPVVFTEFGVKSARDATIDPWKWPELCPDLTYDELTQAAAYRAVFETFGWREWFNGVFIWKYFANSDSLAQEAPTGFSPKDKRAEQVLSRWFALNRSWTTPDMWF